LKGWAALQLATCRGVSRAACSEAGGSDSKPVEEGFAVWRVVRRVRGISSAPVVVFELGLAVTYCFEGTLDEESFADPVDFGDELALEKSYIPEAVAEPEAAFGHMVASDRH
jgi:hypothetical protein